MGLLVMTNPQLDSSFCLETTKLTSSSSTGTIYEIGSKTTLNANKKKSGRVFVLRKEESEKRLVLEKELEFKPSFNEYLKAMDSVKTARDTQPKLMDKSSAYSTEDDLQENVNLRKIDEKGSVVSKSRDGKLKRVSTGETSNGRSSLCQRDNGVEPKLKDSHFDKGATFRNASRDSPFKRSNTTTSTDARGKLVCDQNSSKMVKASHFDKGSTFRNASRDSPFKRSNTTTSIDARRKLVCDQNSSKMVMFGTKGKNSFEREKDGVRSWGRGAHDGGTPERNLIPVQKDTNENEVEPRSRRLISSSKSFHVKSGVDSSWEVERAAFNTFEEDNDIMDKSRVSKMEMEERIQNLARRLNGADINVPEWMFSKMMRSARIRFSNHSILRVIQILGKLGTGGGYYK